MLRKKMLRKTLSMLTATVLLVALFAGCAPGTDGGDPASPPPDNPPPGSDTTPAPNDPADPADPPVPPDPDYNPYEIEGMISIAYPEGETDEIVPVLDAFRAAYPNITVIDVPFSGSYGGAFNEFLTERAASNDMPDVMWLDWNDFAPQVASGYVMPLNDLVAGDPDAAHVPSGMTDPYTFGGKLYAFPCQMNAMGITINLDMIDELNLDKPSYDWTWDEFVEFVRAGITATTAGAALLDDLDVAYSAQADGFYATAYDWQNQRFDFTGQWLPAVNKMLELNAVPGLNASAMKFPKDDEGQTPIDSDYVAKFGEEGKDDNHFLFKNGLALLCTNATWNDNWMRNECKINWDYWPYPSLDANTPVKTPIHVDCSYITSTCENPEAAYQLLKWLTFGVEGNLQRLDIFAERHDRQQVEGDTKLLKTWFIPCTQHPDVIAKFEQSPHLTEGLAELYKSTTNSIRGDLNKFLPNFDEYWGSIGVWGLLDDARQGRANAADIAAQLDQMVNDGFQKALADFNAKVG